MYPEKKITQLSKYLSKILRHRPQVLGLTLDEQGWADVHTLIQKMNTAGLGMTMPLLRHIVSTNSKKRFAFNDDYSKIRASQGHSIEVDLAYEAKMPLPVLYHGTSQDALISILEKGLDKRDRHHVHMSTETETAKTVGSRHGKPVILVIDAQQMYKNGHRFYQSENGVWLTDHVPPSYISRLD